MGQIYGDIGEISSAPLSSAASNSTAFLARLVRVRVGVRVRVRLRLRLRVRVSLLGAPDRLAQRAGVAAGPGLGKGSGSG